ncbi:hypothetical protein L1987_10403 [Smallanthus sonchifolius]|uniref:Uncharacterized protein n=1 Tax=Smallanthus sonchifolius TaxID=185202 RepID=A0ACB9JS48_9ASTR|nr:hypothetical protein L1987_10403 [Smallanthus sonchifolius]
MLSALKPKRRTRFKIIRLSIMGALDKVPSTISIHGEKEEEDEYYSYSDSVDEIRSEMQKKGGATLEDIEWQDSFLSNNDASFPNDPTGELPNSWGAAEASSFHIRGETCLKDRKKNIDQVKGKGILMQLVAANMLKSTNKQGDFAGRPGSICQKFAAADRPDFFFIVNMQIPGPATNFHIAFYYATTTPIKDVPLLHNFVEGDDAYRNSRFKLIPHVSKVGAMACKAKCWKQTLLLGHVLKIQYVRGKNYLELDADVGSSVIAKKVANRVLSSFNNLIVEAAFLIQGSTPEHILETCRMSHIDTSKVACT